MELNALQLGTTGIGRMSAGVCGLNSDGLRRNSFQTTSMFFAKVNISLSSLNHSFVLSPTNDVTADFLPCAENS